MNGKQVRQEMPEIVSAKPADDWPAETWLRIRVKPDDVPGAIRVRRWLKAGLRSYGLIVEEMTLNGPTDARKLID
jgi:hypothetical protein